MPSTEGYRRLAQKRRDRGCCVRCGAEGVQKFAACLDCRRKHNENKQRWKRRRSAA